MAIGRNALCPCRSGRKVKNCCEVERAEEILLERLTPPTSLGRAFVLRALRPMINEIFDFGIEVLGKHGFNRVLASLAEQFDCELSERAEFRDLGYFYTIFSYRPQNPKHVKQNMPIGKTVAEIYRSNCAERHSIGELALLDALLVSPLSFFTLVAVEGNTHIQIQDVFTGEIFTVEDHAAAKSCSLHYLLTGSIFEFGGCWHINYTAATALPPQTEISVIDARDEWFDNRRPQRKELFEVADKMIGLYADLLEAAYKPQPFGLKNTDGHDIVPAKVHFKLFMLPEAAAKRLAPLNTLGEDAQWHEEKKVWKVSWVRQNSAESHMENTGLGSIEISDGRIVAEVQSRERAKAMREMIRSLLGADCSYSRTSYTSLEAAFEKDKGRKNKSASSSIDPSSLSPDDLKMLQKQLQEQFERMSRAWVSSAIPALGGLTPVQAIETASGLEKVESILANCEDMYRKAADAPLAMAGLDVPLIRKLLGI